MNDQARYIESKPFREGYDAAALGMPRQPSESSEWLEGWDAFLTDEARSESARFR